ncbi:MAG: hypothetical protein WAK91_17540 [Candidatus Acidiferrales bacterium]|jgi:hypothetical protein
MSPSGKRALIAVAIVIILAAGVAIYVLRPHAPMAIVPVTPGPPPDVLSLLPPGAPVIAFGDISALRSSPFAADLDALGPAPDQEKDYRDFMRDTGFDYSRDLDKFAVDVWIDTKHPLPDGSPRVSLVAIADGRFDRAKISAYALRTGKISKHGDTDVYEVPMGTPGEKFSFAFLSPGRMALAQSASLDPVFSRSSSMSLDAGTRDRISRVTGATFFAVAKTDDLPKAIAISGLQSGQLNRIVKSIRGLTLAGHPDGNKLVVAAEADCDSMTDALQLSALLDTLRWLGRAALADPKTREQMRPEDAAALDRILKVASVSRDSHWVRVRADIPPDILKSSPAPSHSTGNK